MIAKILAKGSAADIVGYVMREFHDKEQYTADTWRVIDSDGILGSDYRRIVDSFDIGASLNRRISKPIGHIAVSFDKADLPRLTDEFMVQLAKEYMERMGIRDTQYLIVRHLETGSPHFHIVYNRVNLHGKAIDESNNFDKSREATKAIKLKYGLTFSPKKKLYEDAIAEMKPKIQAAMYRCKSWNEFRRRLAPAGITIDFTTTATPANRRAYASPTENLPSTARRLTALFPTSVWINSLPRTPGSGRHSPSDRHRFQWQQRSRNHL